MLDSVRQSSTIGVVMPNFNHGRFLREAVEALLNQTRKPDEVIIIDDGSNDESAELISILAAEDDCIRPILHTYNKGAIVRINEIFSGLKADYLLFAASDDVCDPTLLEKTSDMLDRHPQAGLCSTCTRTIYENGSPGLPPVTFDPISKSGYISPQLASSILIRRDGWFWGNTTLYRRTALADIGGFPSDLEGFNDGYASRAISLKFGVCYIPEELSSWRKMVTGMATQSSARAEVGMRIFGLAREMMTHRHRDLFPGAYRRRWAGRWRMRLTSGQCQHPVSEIKDGLEKVWAPLGDMDRAFLWFVKWLSFNASLYRLACLGYAHIRYTPYDLPRTLAVRMSRLVARKLKLGQFAHLTEDT